MKYFTMHIVLDNPGIMFHEIQREIKDAFSMDMSEGTICKALHHLNFCGKKMRIAATQQDDLLHSFYISEVAFYKASMFVFLDETGKDGKDTIHKYECG